MVGPVVLMIAALHQIEVLRANVNRELVVDPQSPVLTTFKLLVDHYRQKEMQMDLKKAYSTKKRKRNSTCRKWIVPRWGLSGPTSSALHESLSISCTTTGTRQRERYCTPGTKVKIRNLMSAIFRHQECSTSSPRRGSQPEVDCLHSGKRQGIPVVSKSIQQLFAACRQRERAWCAGLRSGLRRGELIGLQWADIDFAKKWTPLGGGDGGRECQSRGVQESGASG